MQKVVARYQDGRMVKGTSTNVDPRRPFFHVRPPQGSTVEVALGDLKALFFVRTLDGGSHRRENRPPDPTDPRCRGATVVSLRFTDGEEIVCLTNSFPPTRPYFFAVPVDTRCNNQRILVNRAAVVSMQPVTSCSTSSSAVSRSGPGLSAGKEFPASSSLAWARPSGGDRRTVAS